MKKTSKIKRLVSLGLFFLMSINSFATSVSDNDGSAFITKAEFDALKSNFQSQLDKYNQGIDSKIDTAIASYLAGIKLTKEPINYWNTIMGATGNYFWFLNCLDGTYGTVASSGINTYKSKLDLTVKRSQYYNVWTNPKWMFGGLHRYRTAEVHNWVFVALTNSTINDYVNVFNGIPGTKERKIAHGQISHVAVNADYWFDPPATYTTQPENVTGADVIASNTFDKKKFLKVLTKAEDGKGAAFVYHLDGLNRKFLRECDKTHYLAMMINANGHTYKDYGKNTRADLLAVYLNETGMDDATNLSVFFNSYMTKVGETISVGTPLTDETEAPTSGTWGSMTSSVVRITDGLDYSYFQFGTFPTSTLVAINDSQPLRTSIADYDLVTISANQTESTKPWVWYKGNGPQDGAGTISGVECKYYAPKFAYEELNLEEFCQEILTNNLGYDIKIGNGAPICKIQDEGKLKLRFKLKNLDSNADYIKLGFSNDCFDKGNFTTGAKKYLNGSGWKIYQNGIEYTEEFEVEKDEIVWVNMYGTDTSGAYLINDGVTFDSLQIDFERVGG